MKKKFRLPELMNLQRVSFHNLLEKRLTIELENFGILQSHDYKLVFCIKSRSLRLHKPRLSIYTSFLQKRTYGIRLTIEATILRFIEINSHFLGSQLLRQGFNKVSTNRHYCLTKNIYEKRFRFTLGNLPLMTPYGTFLIDGTSRVIVHQLVKTPGIYYQRSGHGFITSFISSKGAWLRTFMDQKRHLWAKIDKLDKIPLWLFIRALGFPKQKIFTVIDSKIAFSFQGPLVRSLKNEVQQNTHGDVKIIRLLLLFIMELPSSILKRYSNFEKDAFFRKMLFLLIFKDPVLYKEFKFYLYSHLQVFNKNLKGNFQVNTYEALDLVNYFCTPIHQSQFVNDRIFIERRLFDWQRYDLGFYGRRHLERRLSINKSFLPLQTIRPEDILCSINTLFDFTRTTLGKSQLDSMDDLKNRRVKTAGELIQNQISVGLRNSRIKLVEQLYSNKYNSLNDRFFSRICAFDILLQRFFASNQLSQYLDQTNGLAAVTHQRRLSSLGVGGLNQSSAGIVAREIHSSHYGRICPIETPEGKNAGLVNSLSTYAMLNGDGFITTPLFRTRNGYVKKLFGQFSLTSTSEEPFLIIPGDTNVSSLGFIKKQKLVGRFSQSFTVYLRTKVNFVGLSPIQMISIATSLVPFLEHNDANRALMGSNMQRQAIPTISNTVPIVNTGLETRVAFESGYTMRTQKSGLLTMIVANQLSLKEKLRHFTQKPKYLHRSNQETPAYHKLIGHVGEYLTRGRVINNGPSTFNGSLALGQNLLIAYLPWYGSNFEDSIVISERLVQQGLYTSLHLIRYETEFLINSDGLRQQTLSLSQKHLNSYGIVKNSSNVTGGDILVAKTSLISNKVDPVQGFLRILFSMPLEPYYRDESLRLPNSIYGNVIHVHTTWSTTRKSNSIDINTFFKLTQSYQRILSAVKIAFNPVEVRVYVSHYRDLKVGDKMSGRHGNKGVISEILPVEDLPFLQNGVVVDLLLNPLGVPSRMNVGQIFETLLGFAGKGLHEVYRITPFDEMYSKDASNWITYSKLNFAKHLTMAKWFYNKNFPGKQYLFNGQTGSVFDQPILVGYPYILKLIHLVDKKIHARETSRYAMITQQPTQGKRHNGGQRVGEMEIWALEGFGASYILQELLTLKADDLQGRTKTHSRLIKRKALPWPTIPATFQYLLHQLRALCCDITICEF